MSRKQGKELSMRKVREILRLGLVCQLSQRRIAQSCHMSQASVSKFLNLAKQRELEGAQVSQFSDEELMKALGLNSEVICYKIAPMPDFKQIHEELKKKSVTLRLLWEEYKYLHPRNSAQDGRIAKLPHRFDRGVCECGGRGDDLRHLQQC